MDINSLNRDLNPKYMNKISIYNIVIDKIIAENSERGINNLYRIQKTDFLLHKEFLSYRESIKILKKPQSQDFFC